MYINNSELCDLDALISFLDEALERNPRSFIEGYGTIKDLINKAEETSEKIRDRSAHTLARKIAKEQ